MEKNGEAACRPPRDWGVNPHQSKIVELETEMLLVGVIVGEE